MSQINQTSIRQLSFYVLLIAMGIFLFNQFSSFIPALLGAITLYIIMRGSMHQLITKKKMGRGLAATLLMLASFLIFLVPVVFTINMLSSKIGYVIAHSNETVKTITTYIDKLEKEYNIELMTDDNIRKVSTLIAEKLPTVLGATFNSLTTIFMMYFILYFLLTSTRELEYWLYRNIPLKDENLQLIGKELKKLVISNALGIPLTAILQGVVAFFGYWFLGTDDLGFWFAFTCISAMIPFVGAALAYVTVAILFLAAGNNTNAIIMLVYGFGVVGSIDNIFRFSLQKKMGNVHPMVTVFGVIAGINLFGFIGLIFGPILIAMFILLIRIYLNEFSEPKPILSSEDEPVSE
jgi:predicted PurR-regulated permease PerM